MNKKNCAILATLILGCLLLFLYSIFFAGAVGGFGSLSKQPLSEKEIIFIESLRKKKQIDFRYHGLSKLEIRGEEINYNYPIYIMPLGDKKLSNIPTDSLSMLSDTLYTEWVNALQYKSSFHKIEFIFSENNEMNVIFRKEYKVE